HLAENMRIVAARRELPCFAKERDRLVFDIAYSSEVNQDLSARRCSLSEVLRCLRERIQKLPHAFPVPECLGRIVEPRPFGCAAMPLRGFPSFARSFPVVGEERRPLAELPGLQLLDRAPDRAVNVRFPLRELRAVCNLPSQGMLEGILGLWIEHLLVD